jgi:DNA-binding transcriptional regulator YiaG
VAGKDGRQRALPFGRRTAQALTATFESAPAIPAPPRCFGTDIRDLRGETQQELGRLLGWSVSTVSRFEAAAERPDQATHRRYCALAPTSPRRQ